MHYAFHTLVLEELTSSHPGLNENVIHYGTMIMNHTLQGVSNTLPFLKVTSKE